MWTSVINFVCDKLFPKRDVDQPIRETDPPNCLYGKRIKLSDPDSVSKNVFLTYQRLPMQAKENVQKVETEDDNDDEGCCVIAEIPKGKNLGPTLSTQSKVNSMEKFKWKENLRALGEKHKDLRQDVKQSTPSLVWNSNALPQNEKRKFFNSQRCFVTPSKTVKSKIESRNQLRKKMNFLQECYRLKEKYQYIQLLQSQTSCLVAKNQGKMISFSSPCTIPVIDLTNDKNDTENKEEIVVNIPSTDDDDIQIIREIQGVKSFDEALKIGSRNKKFNGSKTPFITGTWPTSSRKMRDEQILALLEDSTQPLETQLQDIMQISDQRTKEEDQKHEKYSLLKFTSEQERKIQAALRLEPQNEVLTEGFGLSITRRDMHCLQNLNWLNDEVINFYMNLIMDRSKNNSALPKVYAFNTFFYPKLVSGGYQSLKRWTKNIDIYSCDLILVPIHLGMHWCLSVIDFRTKFIKYFDSVGSPNDSCLEYLFRYLRHEHLDKKKKFFETEGWMLINVEDTPQQMNGSDCGVFSCMFAEYQARDAEISFTQDEMPYFRKKIVIELLEKKLLT